MNPGIHKQLQKLYYPVLLLVLELDVCRVRKDGDRLRGFKGNSYFLFMCNPPKWRPFWAYFTFTFTFYWMEIITVTLSFLEILSLKKISSLFFNISKNLEQNQSPMFVFKKDRANYKFSKNCSANKYQFPWTHYCPNTTIYSQFLRRWRKHWR